MSTTTVTRWSTTKTIGDDPPTCEAKVRTMVKSIVVAHLRVGEVRDFVTAVDAADIPDEVFITVEKESGHPRLIMVEWERPDEAGAGL